MRLAAGYLVLLGASVLSSTAAAEAIAPPDDPDEEIREPRIAPVKRFTAGLFFTGHGGGIDGISSGGMGPTAELALGAGRTQYFLEAHLGWVTAGRGETSTTGKLARGAAGIRWIARSFEMERSGAVELTLEGTAGAQRYWWNDGGRLARPELAIGWGFQIRKYRRPHLSARMVLRAFWAPVRDDAATTLARCASGCEPTTSGFGNGGIMVSIGAAL